MGGLGGAGIEERGERAGLVAKGGKRAGFVRTGTEEEQKGSKEPTEMVDRYRRRQEDRGRQDAEWDRPLLQAPLDRGCFPK